MNDTLPPLAIRPPFRVLRSREGGDYGVAEAGSLRAAVDTATALAEYHGWDVVVVDADGMTVARRRPSREE